ncbi:glutathione S-transferase-like protein [Xylaria flabelliformis]|nr:glutathione S-transferase-like protein [Xylaria flabelliformis]
MSLKPLKVYGVYGPNPSKVIVVIEELGLQWEDQGVGIGDVKKPHFVAVNPNGRLPAIYDPNTDLTLWESSAIVDYLVETYDKDNKISFPKGSNEAYQCKQWLFFQASGQGPYYGQAMWFHNRHAIKVPSAFERYAGEINRVTGVLESVLSAKKGNGDGPYLVGDKLSFADLAFYTWQTTVVWALPEGTVDYSVAPTVKAWIDKIAERPSVKAMQAAAIKAAEAARKAKE